MIVPDHWAEARRQHRSGSRRITIRRFGWSNVSEADALQVAESRADEALARHLRGDRIEARERKVAYNGAFGVPIREEVLSRHGDVVVTRNAYGARCLNTPRVLIADIDFTPSGSVRWPMACFFAMALASLFVGAWRGSWGLAAVGVLASVLLSTSVGSVLRSLWLAAQGGQARIARRRIDAYLRRHPEWGLRIYETPNGLRLLVTHQTFDAGTDAVEQFFAAVGTDPIYVRMCRHQRCFRARLSAKPWRIGIAAHMRPRPGIWPVAPERRAERDAWIARYESAAARHAACRFVTALGANGVHMDVADVLALHDLESGALQVARPLA